MTDKETPMLQKKIYGVEAARKALINKGGSYIAFSEENETFLRHLAVQSQETLTSTVNKLVEAARRTFDELAEEAGEQNHEADLNPHTSTATFGQHEPVDAVVEPAPLGAGAVSEGSSAPAEPVSAAGVYDPHNPSAQTYADNH
jgi:hypothetical protein